MFNHNHMFQHPQWNRTFVYFYYGKCNLVYFFRAKSARVITFEQFNQALTELALKRFKGKSKEEALQQIYGLIVGKEPANAGITVS